MRLRRGSGDEEDGRFDILGTRIPLVSLVYVLTVSQYLNFRHAANALNVSQSSVSQRIKDLEQVLDTVLFERRHRGVRLTEAGRYFVDEVSAGLDHLDHAVKTVSSLSRGVGGEINLGLQSVISGGFLHDLIARFRTENPDIRLQLHDGRAVDLVREVREGTLDVAFIVGPIDATDCHSLRLWTEALFVALSEGHRLSATTGVSWADLAQEVFLVRQSGTGPQVHTHLVRRIMEYGSPPRIKRSDVERDTLMAEVAMEQGVTLITQSATLVPYPGVVFRPILDEAEPAFFSAVWSPYNQSQTLRHLLDMARKLARSLETADKSGAIE